jgi:peptidoglycan hydrolase CwlO-like protein
MSILKWTMESVWAAIAVVVTTVGSLYTTSYHLGTVNQQIVDLQKRSTQTEAHLDKHDDQLTEIKQQNSATQQSLSDIKDAVHDIQNQVRKHGNNE